MLGVWIGRNVYQFPCFQYQSSIKISISFYCQLHISRMHQYRSIRDVTLTLKIKYLECCVTRSAYKVLMLL